MNTELLFAWVGFDDDDAARLRRLHPQVMAHAPALVDRFYDAALRQPTTRAIVGDEARQARLRGTLTTWLDEMLRGPWDAAWLARRQKIGDVHVRVGLPSQYMFVAMNVIVDGCVELARAAGDDDGAVARAVRRVADVELAVMVGSYIDAREKKELDALSQLLFAHLPTAVLLVDVDDHVVASTARSGLLTPSDHGPRLRDAVDVGVRDALGLEGLLAAARQSGAEVSSGQVDVPRKDGARRVVRATVVPLGHTRADALVHLEDLTAPLVAEARAQQTEHLAHLGTMAASVAHEIRNPLAGISGTVQVIGNSLPVADPRRRALDKVLEQVTRLGALVGDLLTFARPITAHRRVVDLAAVARDAITDTDHHGPGGAVVVGSGSGFADPALLRQVIVNLVDNAFEAGAQHVDVVVDEGAIDVNDDGPGVAADIAARVFEPFFTTRVRGTGLGLPVSRRMAEAMGGTLELTSPEGRGARFALRLAGEPSRSPG